MSQSITWQQLDAFRHPYMMKMICWSSNRIRMGKKRIVRPRRATQTQHLMATILLALTQSSQTSLLNMKINSLYYSCFPSQQISVHHPSFSIWWNSGVSSCMISQQICRFCVMISHKCESKSPFERLMNPYHQILTEF